MTALQPVEILRFAAAMTLLAMPGVLVVRALWSGSDSASRVALGIAVGLALQLVGVMWVAYVDLDWQWVVVAAAWSIGGLLYLRLRTRGEAEHEPRSWDRLSWLLLAVIVLQLVLALKLVAYDVLPRGSDAIYHVSIAQKYLTTAHWPEDFWPYDPVAPDYPPASHWLCAFVSQIAHVPVHRVYQLLMIFVLCTISGLVHALGSGIAGRRVGVLSALCFVTMSNWGGFDLLRWGSLPNALAVQLLLGLATALRFRHRPAFVPVSALLLAALVQTHHLTALIGFVAWIGMLGLLRWDRRPTSGLLRDYARALAMATLAAFPFLVVYAHHVVGRLTSGRPSAGAEAEGPAFFNVAEPVLWPWDWVMDLGPLLCGLAILGGIVWRASVRRSEDALLERWLLGWLIAVGGAYLLLDWGLRAATAWLAGGALAVLTPSRFLTDLVYPLSLLAGLALSWIWDRKPAVAALLIASGVGHALWLTVSMPGLALRPDELATMVWMRDHVAQDALVLGNHPWQAYVAGREGAVMALRQEELSPYTERKRSLAAGGRAAIAAFARETGRPIYVRVRRPLDDAELQLVFGSGDERLYRYQPASP